MHKTNNITLGGRLFVIEDDAYQSLNSYLESIRSHFRASGDNLDEIMPDIESGLAQHFEERLSGGKQYLDPDDVEAVIKEMGTVEDFKDEDVISDEKKEESHANRKRLYRNPDDIVIAGVCSGLGEYFNIDPVFFRVLFVALVLLGGSGVLIYLLLWVAVPEAVTTAQKLEMSGGAVNLLNLSRYMPEGKETKRKLKKAISAPARAIRALARALGRLIAAVWSVIRILVGLGLSGFAFIFFAASSFFGAIFVFNPNSPYFNIPFSAIEKGDYYAIIVSLYFSLAIPLAFSFLLGIGILRKNFRLRFSVWGPMLGFWLLAMTSFWVYAFKMAPGLEDYYSSEASREYSLVQAGNIEISGRYFVTIEKSESPYLKITGSPDALDRFIMDDGDDQLVISEKDVDHCGLFCRYRPADIVIGSPDFARISVSGRSVLSSGKGFTEDEIALSFHGDSGANIYMNAQQADISSDGSSQVDLLGGDIGRLDASVSGNSYLSNFYAPAQDMDIKISDMAVAKINATSSLSIDASGWLDTYDFIFYKGRPADLMINSDANDRIISVNSEKEINMIENDLSR